jgi:hypothetical protein
VRLVFKEADGGQPSAVPLPAETIIKLLPHEKPLPDELCFKDEDELGQTTTVPLRAELVNSPLSANILPDKFVTKEEDKVGQPTAVPLPAEIITTLLSPGKPLQRRHSTSNGGNVNYTPVTWEATTKAPQCLYRRKL